MTGSHGDFAKIAVNGWDIGGQSDAIQYQHAYKQNPTMYQNVGVRQFAPGVFAPTCSLSGCVQRGQGQRTAHNLFSPSGIGSSGDTEMIILAALGLNASPVANQDVCVAMDGTLLPDYKRNQSPNEIQKWAAQFRSRGTRLPLFPILLADASQKNSLTTSAYDDGAESVGSVSGGVGILEVLTPTGTAASGTISLTGQPADADKFTLNGTDYTFKTTLTPTAGEILIGGTVAATTNNLFQALVGSVKGSGTNYAAGTTPLPSTVSVSLPSATQVLTITYATTGVAGNAYTLVKTGANLAVSGATLAGGVAGETATIVIQSATSSGGAYTTFCTFTKDMTTRGAELITVPVGTTINRYLKVVITMSAGTMTWAARIAFGRFWPNQA